MVYYGGKHHISKNSTAGSCGRWWSLQDAEALSWPSSATRASQWSLRRLRLAPPAVSTSSRCWFKYRMFAVGIGCCMDEYVGNHLIIRKRFQIKKFTALLSSTIFLRLEILPWCELPPPPTGWNFRKGSPTLDESLRHHRSQQVPRAPFLVESTQLLSLSPSKMALLLPQRSTPWNSLKMRQTRNWTTRRLWGWHGITDMECQLSSDQNPHVVVLSRA